MEREGEILLGKRMMEAMARIRATLCTYGTAAGWHIARASRLLEDAEALKHCVWPPLEEQEPAKYLDELPDLLAQTQRLASVCVQTWAVARRSGEFSPHANARRELCDLLPRFRLRSALYEQLARDPRKPVLAAAVRILAASEGSSPEAVSIEDMMQLPLREFVLREEAVAASIRDLDDARKELCTANEDLAQRIAERYSEIGPDALTFAIAGLRRAANHYDVTRGYSFAEYAQHWVEDFVKKRKS